MAVRQAQRAPSRKSRASGRTRPNYRDEAFVLRAYNLGEADQILVLLTAEHGVVRAVAKGIRKTSSRFGARLDRFSRVNVQIYPSAKPGGAGLGTIADAATMQTFAPQIVADPDVYFAAVAALEMAWLFESSGVFYLLSTTLARLASQPCPLHPTSVVDLFVLQCVQAAGWMPSLVDCAQCGAPGPHHAFHDAAGGAVCPECRPRGSASPPSESVHGLWLLSKGRLGQAAQVLAHGDVRRVAHDLLLRHVRHQVESPCLAYGTLG